MVKNAKKDGSKGKNKYRILDQVLGNIVRLVVEIGLSAVLSDGYGSGSILRGISFEEERSAID